MASPLLLFAPGAGAGSSSAWMSAWARRLEQLGVVKTLDYPYRLQGRRMPDPLPVLVTAHREALRAARHAHTGPVILLGKSMGSRVGCHVSLEEQVDGLVCFGYPLQSAGKTPKLRDKVLKQLTTPILFIQGTRDALCPLDRLEQVRAEMSTATHLHVVTGGNHSLEVTQTALKQQGLTEAAVEQQILESIRRFIAP